MMRGMVERTENAARCMRRLRSWCATCAGASAPSRFSTASTSTSRAASITTIVGPSGCGKTVLLKHLNLLLRPDSGSIVIDGVDVTRLRNRGLDEVREKFGMLFPGGRAVRFDERVR